MTWFPAKSRSNSRHAGRFAWAGLTLVLAGLVLFGASVALTTLAASELDSVNQRQTIVRIATVLALVIGSLLLGAFWCVISGYQRRLAAGALREIEQARQSEERFRSLVQNMSDAILILDSAGVIQYASPAAEHGWGYGDGELLGRLALSLVVAEEQPRARAQFCSGCEQPGATWTTELHLRNADGSLRDVEAIATNLLDRPAVGGVVVTYRDITERNTHERTLKELAFLDNLTGLANWSRLRSELERTFEGKSASGQLGLLLLDIDHFREVNDTFGHQRGDQLLRQVGERLAAQLANGDVVARLGGDEFAMLLRGVDAARARARADRLLAALDLPFEIDGAPVQLSGSIGIALHPDHGTDADMLFSRADIAMYTAKDKRSGCVVYAPDQDHHSPERLALVHDLRRAIERDEFVLHFQPQIDVRSGVLSGCEALVRWQHPVRGLLSPDAFIPAALDSRLIQPLSRWVLRKTLEQFGAWRSAGLSLPVSVNLSAPDLRDTRLPDYIAELTACNDALAHHLRIEITESSLMVDPDGSREVLARLREQGVQIAIDDFGTGYSSLAYLKDLGLTEHTRADAASARFVAAALSSRYGTNSSFSLNIGRRRRLPSAFSRKRTPISSPFT